MADHKYMGPAEAAATLERALDALRSGGLENERAAKVKLVIENMSFSKEIDTASQGKLEIEKVVVYSTLCTNAFFFFTLRLKTNVCCIEFNCYVRPRVIFLCNLL